MEFKMIQKEIQLQSRGWIPTFHDISIDVHKIVEESGIYLSEQYQTREAAKEAADAKNQELKEAQKDS
jgi:hypothetical protein